jgi:hypothetical protein
MKKRYLPSTAEKAETKTTHPTKHLLCRRLMTVNSVWHWFIITNITTTTTANNPERQ